MERLEDCLSFLVGKAAQQVTKECREALAPYGVTPVQFAILKILWETDGRSGAELCQRLLLDSATVTGLVDRMETADLVARRPDPAGDRRVNRVYLTRHGAELEPALCRVMDQVNADFAARLGAGRASGFWRDLGLIGGLAGR